MDVNLSYLILKREEKNSNYEYLLTKTVWRLYNTLLMYCCAYTHIRISNVLIYYATTLAHTLYKNNICIKMLLQCFL